MLTLVRQQLQLYSVYIWLWLSEVYAWQGVSGVSGHFSTNNFSKEHIYYL